MRRPPGGPSTAFQRLLRRVRGEVHRRRLLPPGGRVLVAVSGGQDSLALAEVLRSLHASARPGRRWLSLALAHTDHCWPGDAGCARHVAAYARDARLPLHMASPGGDEPVAASEAAARSWRYDALAAIARAHGYTHVAVGHTQSDLAETLLFNLAHGAGADGLSSLTWARPLPPPVAGAPAALERPPPVAGAPVALERPLLSTTRDETAAVCAERGLAVWSDVYNRDARFARFRTRAHVLPYLCEHYNPRVEEALARTAHLLRDDCAALDAVARRVYRATVTRAVGGGIVRIARRPLAEEPVAVQRRVLRIVLKRDVRVSTRTPVFTQVESLVRLLAAAPGTTLPSLPRAGAAAVEGGDIVIRVGERAGGVAGGEDARSGAAAPRPPRTCHRLLAPADLRRWLDAGGGPPPPAVGLAQVEAVLGR